MIIEQFVDPKVKAALGKDEKGNLFYHDGKQCHVYRNYDGIYDFVCGGESAKEKSHYDTKYAKTRLGPLSLEDVSKEWFDTSSPENLILLQSLGNLRNKKVLLLGNGTSFKELYFYCLGADVVYTDLSIEAVKYVKNLFYESKLREINRGSIEFYAIDSFFMPFPDESFDIVYGYAFVHHIENLNPFFVEINRCLKRNGICRFLDDAYSPLWVFIKNSVLKPLQRYSHKKAGISPADLVATKKGGYKKEELHQIMLDFRFEEIIFDRISFFLYLWKRGVTKLLGKNNSLIFRKGTPVMTKLDKFITKRTHLMERNLLRLIWGFDK